MVGGQTDVRGQLLTCCVGQKAVHVKPNVGQLAVDTGQFGVTCGGQSGATLVSGGQCGEVCVSGGGHCGAPCVNGGHFSKW